MKSNVRLEKHESSSWTGMCCLRINFTTKNILTTSGVKAPYLDFAFWLCACYDDGEGNVMSYVCRNNSDRVTFVSRKLP